MPDTKGQMSWRQQFGANCKSLHVRRTPHEPWVPVWQVPGLHVADGVVGSFGDAPPLPVSKGFRAFQVLWSQGWELLDQDGRVVERECQSQNFANSAQP